MFGISYIPYDWYIIQDNKCTCIINFLDRLNFYFVLYMIYLQSMCKQWCEY